jgi:hypothetical protein
VDRSPCGRMVKVRKRYRIHWIPATDLVEPKQKLQQVRHSFLYEI